MLRQAAVMLWLRHSDVLLLRCKVMWCLPTSPQGETSLTQWTSLPKATSLARKGKHRSKNKSTSYEVLFVLRRVDKKEDSVEMPTIKQFNIKVKIGREKSRPFFVLSCPQGIVCYTLFDFREVKEWCCGKPQWCYGSAIEMYCSRWLQSDVMFAHFAVKRNITHAVNITAEGNISCPQGQTSFGWPALSQVAVGGSFFAFSFQLPFACMGV